MDTPLENAETLQNLLIAHATGGSESELDYRNLRASLSADPKVAQLLPQFIRTCRNLGQFWQFIKYEHGTYAARRTFIWEAFRPVLEHLDRLPSPPDASVGEILREFDTATVHAAWLKALERREGDPEGAITAARTLLEAVCKHILDAAAVKYDDGLELPKLYKLTAKHLRLAPDQHTEDIFKQILGGCASVVEGLGALRNKLSDAHGGGRRRAKPAPRHAELAVNLAGTLAMFLVSTALMRQAPAA